MKSKSPVISIKNISKSFPVRDKKVPVLKDISLDIYSGEFVIIFGPSGCGKSTLLNTVLGLERPDQGKIIIRGEDIYNKTEDERAKFRHDKFGVIYQQSNWLKAFNVIENIAFSLYVSGMGFIRSKKRAENILALFGMEEYAKYIPLELSGGQQQKIAMCRAMVANPWIIMADEPTGNLDSVSSMDVMNIFKFVNEESKRTVLMVSHNQDFEQYATKVVYMRDGQINKIIDKKKVNVDTEEAKDLLEIALEN